LEIAEAAPQRVWALRKAAWAIEDLPQDIGLVHQQMGRRGIESLPGVGPRLAPEITRLMELLRPVNRL